MFAMKTLFDFLFCSVNKERRGLVSLSTLFPMSFVEASIVHPFMLKEKDAVSSCLQINFHKNSRNRTIL